MPVPLMLATLTDRRDFGEGWLLERKFDGERCVARKAGDEVRLKTHNGKDLSGTYPEVDSALAAQRARELLLDGEVVAFDGDQTSFSRLQQRLGVTRPSRNQVASYPVVSASSTCSRSTARISPASSCWSVALGWPRLCGQGRRFSSAKPGAATPSEGSRRPVGRAGKV